MAKTDPRPSGAPSRGHSLTEALARAQPTQAGGQEVRLALTTPLGSVLAIQVGGEVLLRHLNTIYPAGDGHYSNEDGKWMEQVVPTLMWRPV